MHRTRLQLVRSRPESVWVVTDGAGVWPAPSSSEGDGRTVWCWARLPNEDSQGVTVFLGRVTVNAPAAGTPTSPRSKATRSPPSAVKAMSSSAAARESASENTSSR